MSQPYPHSARTVLRAGLPTLVLALLAVVAVLGWYLWVPVPQKEDSPWLVFGSIVLISVLYIAVGLWSLVRINKSRHPLRVGLTSLAVMITAMVVLFALTYVSMSARDPGAFNVPLDKISALYFTMTVLSTVGFGDIHASNHAGMIAVMIQMVVGLTLITTVARVMVAAARSATRRKFEQQQG